MQQKLLPGHSGSFGRKDFLQRYLSFSTLSSCVSRVVYWRASLDRATDAGTNRQAEATFEGTHYLDRCAAEKFGCAFSLFLNVLRFLQLSGHRTPCCSMTPPRHDQFMRGYGLWCG